MFNDSSGTNISFYKIITTVYYSFSKKDGHVKKKKKKERKTDKEGRTEQNRNAPILLI